MKKLILGLCLVLLLTGCLNSNYTSNERKFISMAEDYYEKALKSTTSSDFYTITLLDLSNANYDISRFIKGDCDSSSSVTIAVDGHKTQATVNLICNK